MKHIKFIQISFLVCSLSAYGQTEYFNNLNLKYPLTEPNPNEQIEEGFVTFATTSYFPLLEVMIDSIHAFSTRPIVAFGINADIPFDSKKYPQLIKKRIDINLKEVNIFFLKPRIIYESNIKYGIYIEADDILTQEGNLLFDWARTAENYPLCPIHPQDVYNQQALMKALEIPHKTMHYVHGHILFSPSCKDFIKEWYETCLSHGHLAIDFDESILNVLLWKYNATRCTELFDPFTCHETVNYYLNNSNYDPVRKILYLMFQGCKDVGYERSVLNKLIAHSKEKLHSQDL